MNAFVWPRGVNKHPFLVDLSSLRRLWETSSALRLQATALIFFSLPNAIRKLLLIFNDKAFPEEEWRMRNSTFLPSIMLPFPSKICNFTKVIFYLTSEAKSVVILKSQNVTSWNMIFPTQRKNTQHKQTVDWPRNENHILIKILFLKKSILLMVITEHIHFNVNSSMANFLFPVFVVRCNQYLIIILSSYGTRLRQHF